MIMFKVKFIDIGREKKCFEEECKTKLTREWIEKKIKPYILNARVEILYLENGNMGLFVGEVRKVGELEIVEV